MRSLEHVDGRPAGVDPQVTARFRAGGVPGVPGAGTKEHTMGLLDGKVAHAVVVDQRIRRRPPGHPRFTPPGHV